MLFIQSIDTYYEKQGRSSDYARLRTGDLFRKSIFTEGTRDRYKNYNELLKFIRIFKEDDRYRIMFCDENVEWCPTKRRGHNEAFNNENSIYYHRDTLNETAFILGKNEYGRIIYNNRYVDPDSQWWYYGWYIYNINCPRLLDKIRVLFYNHCLQLKGCGA